MFRSITVFKIIAFSLVVGLLPVNAAQAGFSITFSDGYYYQPAPVYIQPYPVAPAYYIDRYDRRYYRDAPYYHGRHGKRYFRSRPQRFGRPYVIGRNDFSRPHKRRHRASNRHQRFGGRQR